MTSSRNTAWALGGALLLLVPPRLAGAAETFEGFTYYFGDLHTHTGASGDGGSAGLGTCTGECGALADLGELAGEQHLDFLAVTDHVNGPHEASEDAHQLVLSTLLALNDPDSLVTIPGGELVIFHSDGQPLGHKHVLLFGTDEHLAELQVRDFRLNPDRTESSPCEAVWTLADRLEGAFGPVLVVPHHPALVLPMATDWSCHHPEWQPVVEVYSGHGSSMGDQTGFDPPWSGTVAAGTVHHALDPEGPALRLGFIASTDRHDTHPGAVCQLDSQLTGHPYGGGLAVVAIPESESFDRGAIHLALSAGHAYASSGPRLPVAVEYRSGGARLGGWGDELPLPAGQPLDVLVRVPDPTAVLSVVLVEPGGDFRMSAAGPRSWRASLTAEEVPDWVYPRLRLDGAIVEPEGCEDGGEDQDEFLWISPSWVGSGPADLDGDGVSWGEGDCHDGDPEVHPGAEEVCDNEVDDDCDGLEDRLDPACRPGVGIPWVEETDDTGSDEVAPRCGCAAGSSSTWVWIVAPWLLWSTRRRRSPRGGLLAVLLLAACSRDPTETGDSSVGLELPEPIPAGDDHLARVVHLPTAVAAPQGLAVMVVYPKDLDAARFEDGLPVVVEVDGGFGDATLGEPRDEVAVDFPGIVHVRASLPGAGGGEWASGGVYDRRGADSLAAIADVVRFAAGTLTLADRAEVDDVVDLEVDRGCVGVLGRSNGGNLAALLPVAGVDELAFLVTWETPIDDLFVLNVIGAQTADPDPGFDADGNGVTWDDMVHPGYLAYSCGLSGGCPIDLGGMAWSGGALFRDGDGDGQLGDGAGTTDLDGNGMLDDDEDVAYQSVPDLDDRLVFPLPVLDAAAEQGVFGADWPAAVATRAQAEAFWALRSGLDRIPAYPTDAPPTMVLGARRDHVQAAVDHPHVWLAYSAFLEHGTWARLNPDVAYLVPSAGLNPEGLVEFPAGAAIQATELPDGLAPYLPGFMTHALLYASVLEMGDRCHLDRWEPDLTLPLSPVRTCPTCLPPPTEDR